MRRANVTYPKGFKVLIGDDRSQAATMVIEPGKQEGSAENKHRGADQWLFVADGSGEAIVNGHKYDLKPGSLVLIERGDTHEIRNTGKDALKTLNFYLPPAYSGDGEELPPGQG